MYKHKENYTDSNMVVIKVDEHNKISVWIDYLGDTKINHERDGKLVGSFSLTGNSPKNSIFTSNF